MDGNTVKWMQSMASKSNAVLIGSVIISENNRFYNRLLVVHPNGTIEHYNKRHTFTLAGEHKVFTAGKKKLIVNLKGWRICPLICYDLRFPVWARNTENYEVLLYVANWPKVRIEAWSTLLRARAIENMSYCIGVNRVGLDGNSHEYSGHSAAYNALGKRLDTIPDGKEVVQVISLSKSHLESSRTKFNFLNDRDEFTLLKA